LAAQFGEPNLEQLERIHRRKTGAMINVSLRLGGLVAQADGAKLAALDAYGQRLGLAFQIVDDLLDCEGTAENLGKRTGKDADRGKMTFPAVLGMEESRRRAKELVAAAIDAAGHFGPRGAGLAALARYVEERNH
jgi:geranylgeranyl diphosphate synthase type II